MNTDSNSKIERLYTILSLEQQPNPRLNTTQVDKLKSLQRNILINISSGYRSVSYSSISTMKEVIPFTQQIDLTNKRKYLKFKIKSEFLK